MNPIQKQAYENIAAVAGLRTSAESIAVAQTPTYLKEPMKVADFAVGVFFRRWEPWQQSLGNPEVFHHNQLTLIVDTPH